ncbi:MAG: regulatory iron-sulfur-containing complex subunit RicT [Phycisphaerales bacterium]
MTIVPLPVFEQDADPARRTALSDEEIYARLSPPATIVVRFGSMRMIGEFPYEGDAKPGCGTKLVARTVRGTEIAEMLTTTCGNSGCSKTVSRQEMLEFIENSGGKEYPFHEHGRVLRVATIEDLNAWSRIQATKPDLLRQARALCAPFELPMKVVEVEPIFGGEMVTVFYLSEERIDFRDLVKDLAAHFRSRIEMRQVGARDEARLVADYERCGQHCCCRNFLKVLKPVSMRSAKTQKATLDPLKISGRCGRLMCCLRYEDETYEDLRKRLPKVKGRVGTSEGPGIVVDTKVLVQLVLVRLEHDGREVAVPVEEPMDPDRCPVPTAPRPRDDEGDPFRGMREDAVRRKTARRDAAPGAQADRAGAASQRASPPPREARPARRSRAEQQDAFRAASKSLEGSSGPLDRPEDGADASVARDAGPTDAPGATSPPSTGDQAGAPAEARGPRRRRRRRRRSGPGDGGAPPA